MLGLTGIAAGLAILALALILGYTVVHGIAYMNLSFLTNGAKPVGETGGGMRNEIFGTLVLVALGSVLALPVGLMAGIFLSEFASPRTATAVRFAADILAGVPSIVVGVFAYAIVVRPCTLILHSRQVWPWLLSWSRLWLARPRKRSVSCPTP